MSPMHEDPALTPWRRLGETLEGSFAARSRGLLAPDFAILGRKGEEIGHLEIHAAEGAELGAGELEARIERSALCGYKMLTDGAEILTAEPLGAWNAPEMKCLDSLYQGRLSLLRNTARAGPAGEKATVRIPGRLRRRRRRLATCRLLPPLPYRRTQTQSLSYGCEQKLRARARPAGLLRQRPSKTKEDKKLNC